MNKLSDIVLITQVVLLGDKRGFDELVRKYQSPLRRFLMSLCGGNRDLSDDLSQEAFIKAYLNLSHFKVASSFQTWLFRIGYNVYLDYLRSTRDTAGLEEASQAALPSSAVSITQDLDVHQALRQISEAERTCIVLFYMEDRSIRDISEITGMAEGTIKSHLSRGRDRMASYLRENGYGK